MSLYGLGLRASFKISDTIRDRGLQAPKDIVRFDNLPMARTALADIGRLPPQKRRRHRTSRDCQRSRRRLGLWR